MTNKINVGVQGNFLFNSLIIGWVKQETMTDEELLEQLKSEFKCKETIERLTKRNLSGSVYEYLTDYIRDYYDVTLAQCSRVSKQLTDFYGIKKFYYEG